jgi:hypothetical protein
MARPVAVIGKTHEVGLPHIAKSGKWACPWMAPRRAWADLVMGGGQAQAALTVPVQAMQKVTSRSAALPLCRLSRPLLRRGEMLRGRESERRICCLDTNGWCNKPGIFAFPLELGP